MAKNKITDYSATNASNTDLGGIDIQGTGYISNGDNAFREIMTHLAETNAGTYPVADTWSFADPGDLTKIARFDCGSITTSSTRVITLPDASTTLVGTDVAQTLTNKSLSDSTTYFVDNSDATKRLQFQLSGIATATTRTVTWPDANFTIGATSGANVPFMSQANTWSNTQTIVESGATSEVLKLTNVSTSNYMSTLWTSVGTDWSLRPAPAGTPDNGKDFGYDFTNAQWYFDNTVNLKNASNPVTIVERTGVTSNAIIQYKTNAASMYAGNATSGAIFAIGSAADLTVAANRVFAASTDYTYFGSQAVNTPGISNTSTGMTLDVVSGYKLRISTTSGTNLSLNVNTNPSDAIDFRYQGAVKGSVTVTSTNTAYNTTSDENLKHFTGTYSYEAAKAVIQADPVRSFTWKDGGEAAIGWGAQTSYAVSPDLATPGRGKPGDDDYRPWGVDQGKRTPYLWAAVSGLIDEIEGLKAEIAALKAA